MTTYVCPFCSKDLIFTGKREFEPWWNDVGALFFKCGCVEHYDWGDALPSNKWKLLPDGTWYCLVVEHDRMTMWKNMSRPKNQVPKKKTFMFR